MTEFIEWKRFGDEKKRILLSVFDAIEKDGLLVTHEGKPFKCRVCKDQIKFKAVSLLHPPKKGDNSWILCDSPLCLSTWMGECDD